MSEYEIDCIGFSLIAKAVPSGTAVASWRHVMNCSRGQPFSIRRVIVGGKHGCGRTPFDRICKADTMTA